MIASIVIFLLSSLLHRSEAESTLISKLQHAKEQNGVQEEVQDEKVVVVFGEGTLHSPGFPLSYPRSTTATWRLLAAHDSAHFLLTFDPRFGLEEPEDGHCKYDYVEVEEPGEGSVLGRWCGSQAAPLPLITKGNQVRVHFVSDEYFPAEPGFCLHYSLVQQKQEVPAVAPPVLQSVDALGEAVSGFGTVEELLKFLEPDRWQLEMEELYKPSWHVLGKSYFHQKKARSMVELNLLRDEVRLYSCTPRNFSVSIREELKRTDAVFWPSCVLVKRCGGNCSCCSQHCYHCSCTPTRTSKKYHEVLMLKMRPGSRVPQKSLTDVPLEHHEECSCVCKSDSD